MIANGSHNKPTSITPHTTTSQPNHHKEINHKLARNSTTSSRMSNPRPNHKMNSYGLSKGSRQGSTKPSTSLVLTTMKKKHSSSPGGGNAHKSAIRHQGDEH